MWKVHKGSTFAATTTPTIPGFTICPPLQVEGSSEGLSQLQAIAQL